MSDPICPACGGGGDRVGARVNGYGIVACSTCGTGYAWPRPTTAQLDEVYTASYYSGGNAGEGYGGYDGLPALNARRQWTALLDYLGPALPGGRRLLDVGCATGAFLAAAACEGWDVAGTDYSAAAAETARRVHHIEVEAGTFAPQHHTAPFDLVTGWHVVEHLVDPREAIESLRAVMAPRSVLFLEAPSWNSVGRRLRRTGWAQLKPPEHITFFTPASLARLVESCGLRVQRAESVYPDIDLSLVPQAERMRVRARNLAGRALSRMGAGGYVRVVATSL